MKDLQLIPKTLKEKTKGVNKKQLALKCAPYVIFGYVLNKVSWLYGQQEGDNTLQKVLDTINGIGGAFHNPLPSFLPRDLLVGVGCGIGFRMVVYYKAKNAKKFRQGVEYGSARWGTAKDIEPYVDPVFEYHEGIETIEEAMKLYNASDPSRMHGIPSIGVNMHIEGTEEWEDEQVDIVSGKRIDVDFLNYTPELRDTPTVQDALKKLIAAYPDKEVNDQETKEAKIQTLATELDQLSQDIDPYGYADTVSDREVQVLMIADDIKNGNIEPLRDFLQTVIEEGTDEDSERQAKELLAKLAEYKPLAKIEELEKQNYNMIDDRLNNGVEKFNREEEKKEQAEKPQVRSSLKERLVAKQKEVAQGKKDSYRR